MRHVLWQSNIIGRDPYSWPTWVRFRHDAILMLGKASVQPMKWHSWWDLYSAVSFIYLVPVGCGNLVISVIKRSCFIYCTILYDYAGPWSHWLRSQSVNRIQSLVFLINWEIQNIIGPRLLWDWPPNLLGPLRGFLGRPWPSQKQNKSLEKKVNNA